ncbi:GNAT family N-acetyltransferase [Vibrio breoganii]
MQLIEPSLEFESSFARFYEDFAANDEINSDYYLEGVLNFKAYIQCLQDEAMGINLVEDYVQCSHFWLVDAQKNIYGAIRVRHNIDTELLALEAGHIGYDIAPEYRSEGYGTLMLKKALLKAKAIGLSKALVVADEDNMASRKVIEANGGQLENVVFGKVYPNPLARYWIECH